jgi:putative oxidoreductase
MKNYALDVGRILLSIIFLGSAATKIADPAGTQAYMAAYGLPLTDLLLVGAIATETVGGLALLLGLKVRLTAVVLTGFLTFATLVFHTNLGDQQQLLHFLKNVAIIGGLVTVMAEGTGSLSLDGSDAPAGQEQAPEQTAPASTGA